jgi:hypothetical protein
MSRFDFFVFVRPSSPYTRVSQILAVFLSKWTFFHFNAAISPKFNPVKNRIVRQFL